MVGELGGLEGDAEEVVGGCGSWFGGDLAEALDDGVHGFIERGGASGDADVLSIREPARAQFFGAFDLHDPSAKRGGFLCELACVVAIASADDDYEVTGPAEIFQCGLALLGGMADGVDEAHLTCGKALLDGGDES